MNPIVIAALVVIVFFFVNKLWKFYAKQSIIWEKGALIPSLPRQWIIGNLGILPRDHCQMGKFMVDMGNDFAAKGENVIAFWMAHVMKVIPLNGIAVKDILDNSQEITKGNDYNVIIPWLGTGLLIATGEKWHSRRKMLTPTFHFKMLDGYLETFNRESKRLSEILEKFVGTGECVDLFPYVKRCALDIICDTAMGILLNSQDDENNEYARAVDEMGHVTTVHSLSPHYWIKPIWKLTNNYKRYTELLEILTNFTKQVIKDRKEEQKLEDISRGKMAFLDMLLQMREENNLSDEDIREEVDTFMFEGHDTTSAGICWTLWCLATHPEIQDRVVEELQSLLGDTGRDITLDDLKRMEYFDRVIKESMRINPPVPFIGRELQGDLNIGNHLVPKGAQMLISPLMIHRNAQIYPDPFKFDPDRFLLENVKKRHAYDYIPFSAGPRNCIGQKFAIYEEKIVVAWIIRRFKISATMGFNENGYVPEIILRPEHGIPLKFERRAN